MFSQVLAVAAFAVAVSARATGQLTTEVQASQCGNAGKISCCKSASSNAGGLVNNLIDGANCIDVPVIAVPVLDQCGGSSNVAACCPHAGDSLIPVSCVPITA